MSAFYSVFVLFVAANAVISAAEVDELFINFKLNHGKKYANANEELKRSRIFADNLKAIREHNELHKSGLVGWTKGINKFSDLTPEEFKATLIIHKSGRVLLKPSNESSNKSLLRAVADAPDSIDWRTKGVVTRVKDQGSCGACVAFAVVAAIEAANGIKNGNLETFSEQQLIDCSTGYGNNGCTGLSFDKSYSYIKDKGLESDTTYAYEEKNSDCKYDASKVVINVPSHVTITDNEDKLKDAVGTVGPVSIAIDATQLQSYSSGIITTACNPITINHAVLVVGYGTENGVDYWIVKNSWGSSWGESGYGRMQRGVNLCGITHENAYPVL